MIRASDLSPETRARMGLPADVPTNKYKVSSKDTRTCDGITFDSKQELHRWRALCQMKSEGSVKMILRQVPFHLPGKSKYLADFMVFFSDGTWQVEDVKSEYTKKMPMYRLKKKQVEELFNIKIVEIGCSGAGGSIRTTSES